MKALTLATVCLLATSTHAQDIIPTPVHDPGPSAMFMQQQAAASAASAQAAQQATQVAVPVQVTQPAPLFAPTAPVQPQPQVQNQAVAPAVFYAPASGDKTVSPQAIEVEVPVYSQFQPKVQVQKIYTQIKDSQFFLELNPLSLKVQGMDFESNNMDDGNPALAFDTDTVKARLVPLDFRFGFENQGWGGFAEVRIADGEDASALTVFSKFSGHKFGAGMVLNSYDYDVKVKRYTSSATGSGDSVEVGPYLYASFQLSNDDSISVEQWNKIGGVYEKTTDGDLSVKGVSFIFHPALDIMFKINPKLQIGTGVEFEYRRFSGDVTIDGIPKYKGVGNSYSFELNLIKTKFIF